LVVVSHLVGLVMELPSRDGTVLSFLDIMVSMLALKGEIGDDRQTTTTEANVLCR